MRYMQKFSERPAQLTILSLFFRVPQKHASCDIYRCRLLHRAIAGRSIQQSHNCTSFEYIGQNHCHTQNTADWPAQPSNSLLGFHSAPKTQLETNHCPQRWRDPCTRPGRLRSRRAPRQPPHLPGRSRARSLDRLPQKALQWRRGSPPLRLPTSPLRVGVTRAGGGSGQACVVGCERGPCSARWKGVLRRWRHSRTTTRGKGAGSGLIESGDGAGSGVEALKDYHTR